MLILNNDELLVEDYGKILKFDFDNIIILKNIKIDIKGADLKIIKLSSLDVVIKGKFSRIDFYE